jgi:hypothetical protein
VCERTARQFENARIGGQNHRAEWAAILRKLDGRDPSFRN